MLSAWFGDEVWCLFTVVRGKPDSGRGEVDDLTAQLQITGDVEYLRVAWLEMSVLVSVACILIARVARLRSLS